MHLRRASKVRLAFLSFLLLQKTPASSAFVPARANGRRRRDNGLEIMAMPPPADGVTEIVRGMMSEAGELTSAVGAEEEAAALTDLANVSSDLVLLSAPETIILRLSAVVQKVLELTSDYLPDHEIRGDELASSVPVLATSIFLLFRSAEPMLKAQFFELDDLDLTAYDLCFRPVGVTMLQFRSMKATGCFEWISREAGTVLIDENEYNMSRLEGDDDDDGNGESCPTDWKYLYWQYDGDIIRSFRGTVFGSVERIDGMHIDNPEAQGLLGDTRFLYNLEQESREKTRNSGGNDCNDNYLMHPIATITIGSRGARLLRIDSQKLFDLMDHDERLESSIRLLLLKSLKLKIGNLLFALQDGGQGGGGDSSANGNLKQEEMKPPLSSCEQDTNS